MLFVESEARARARKATTITKSAADVLVEQTQAQRKAALPTDIFLSHSFKDNELILGIALQIEDLGYKVYIDWRDDPTLDRTHVNKKTATLLRDRLCASKCLLYVTTESSADSKWMPWELGFKDGQSGKVAIVPVASGRQEEYKGQEYLAIYYYISVANDTSKRRRLWVQSSPICYITFDRWLEGEAPTERTGQ